MFGDEICIRLAEEGLAFIYSVVRAGTVIDTAVVQPVREEEEELALPGYYGGSQAMD